MNKLLDIVFSITISDTFALTKAKVIPISITDFSYTLRFIEDKRGSGMIEDHSFDVQMFDLSSRHSVYMQE